MEVIGVLALQGAFALHRPHIEACHAKYQEVLCEKDLEGCDKLIIPGGESTTLLNLIRQRDLFEPLQRYLLNHSSWGICAGAILLARHIENPTQDCLRIIDITISRNGYGSQMHSHSENIDGYQVAYIRAPKIVAYGPDIQVHSTHNQSPTSVGHDRCMVTTFHPELNKDSPSPWHRRFILSNQ